jgi:lactoylglutathione lyase
MLTYTHDHIHLYSADAGAAALFYREMFNGEVIRTHGDGRIDLRVGGQSVFISPVGDASVAHGGPGAVHHFALAVPNLEQAARELKAKGVIFSKDPAEIRPGVKIAFVRAPDGLEVELLQRG